MTPRRKRMTLVFGIVAGVSVAGGRKLHPNIVNEDPYHEGWLVEIKVSDENELEELMDADEYEEFAAGEEEG